MPVVIEVWADPDPKSSDATFMVNGTPSVADADASYEPKTKNTTIWGPGLNFTVKTGKTGMWLHVNIFIPYIPMTNDGKEPELGLLAGELQYVIERAVKHRRLQPGDNSDPALSAPVFSHMAEQIAIVSDDRRYRFGWRQVLYRLRPIVMKQLEENLEWHYFSQKLVTEYEEAFGEESKAYRDPRGTFYHPHTGESFPLGTLQVEKYRRPEWNFNKVLFIEKEGFFEALKAVGWPERNDSAMMTSKGQPSRAARDLIDFIGETGEPVKILCLHDCDAAGTLIYQTLQEATRARPRNH